MNISRTARLLALLVNLATSYHATADTINQANSIKTTRNSPGCKIDQRGTGKFTTHTLDILNQQRIYHLLVPATYQTSRAYPIIFRWHGSGGNGLSGGMEIENYTKEDAIIVSADGLDKNWEAGAESESLLLDERYEYLQFSTDPADLLFFDQLLEKIGSQYCIDTQRIFSYGFSAGGSFSNLLACERGEIIRANAAIASWPRGSNCKGRVATWLLHDRNDDAVAISKGIEVRDKAVQRNGCTRQILQTDGCIQYRGCNSNPVVWCETTGIGHNIQSAFAPARVWKFFNSLQ